MLEKTKICSVNGLEIYDSRGNPTVLAQVRLADGSSGAAAAPSGASTGAYEAHELRDGGSELGGKGVSLAVEAVSTEISDALAGLDALDQRSVDTALISLDGTDNKSRLGANAIIAVSLACARAAAKSYGLPLWRWLGGLSGGRLPIPMLNILNGGAHATNSLDIQEFMIVPHSAKCFSQAMRLASEVYHSLGRLLTANKLSGAVGDEGGFAPNLDKDEDALELICEAIKKAGYEPGKDISLALDLAASEWLDGKDQYKLPKSGKQLEGCELRDYIHSLCVKFPIISVEDPLGEEDFAGFAELTEILSGVQTVGDDLYVTNTQRLKRGIALGSSSAILIKPNQTGTLTETLDCVQTARRAGMKIVISHRSGETEDSFISDLAVGLNAEYIKAGAPARGERLAKYNRLLAIEAYSRAN